MNTRLNSYIFFFLLVFKQDGRIFADAPTNAGASGAAGKFVLTITLALFLDFKNPSADLQMAALYMENKIHSEWFERPLPTLKELQEMSEAIRRGSHGSKDAWKSYTECLDALENLDEVR